MRSKWAALLCLASVTLSPVLPAMSQEIFVPYEDAGTAMYDGSAVYTGAAPLANGGYLFFRKDFDSAVGYNDGYSSVGWFQPLPAGFFGQGQFFVTDDGDFGGSLNGGWRTFVDSQNRVYGAYLGIDFDESRRGNRYEQVSLGVETLGQMWDFRLNGYFPLDTDANFEGVRALGTMPTFQGNNLVLLGTAFYEKPMPGADVEWGFPILDPSGFGRLRSYFGGYVYDSEDKNPAGIRVRLESHINEHVTLGAAFFHDDVNGGMATASVDIRGWSRSLPGLNNKTPSNEAKMYLPIVRNYRVAAETYTDNFSAAALDANGNELDFVWVNNGNAAPGSGTFEIRSTTCPPRSRRRLHPRLAGSEQHQQPGAWRTRWRTASGCSVKASASSSMFPAQVRRHARRLCHRRHRSRMGRAGSASHAQQSRRRRHHPGQQQPGPQFQHCQPAATASPGPASPTSTSAT